MKKSDGITIKPKPKSHLVEKSFAYLNLLIYPIFFGIICDWLWYLIIRHIFSFEGESRETFTIIIAVFVAFSVVLPTITMVRVWDQFDRVYGIIFLYEHEKAKKMPSKDLLDKLTIDYTLEVNKRIPDLIHALIGSYSIFTISSVMIIPYALVETGLFFVFGVSFLHYLVLEVVIELDNVTEGCLRLEVPEEWKSLRHKSDGKLTRILKKMSNPLLVWNRFVTIFNAFRNSKMV